MEYENIKQEIIKSLKSVNQDYYISLIASSENIPHTVKRERNFCYEFYHQLRLNENLMKLIEGYTFSCEFDKRGHELFKNNLIPDFILHRPGEMSFEHKDNLLVIEAKVVLDSKSYSGIAKDFYSLSLMLSEYKYQRGLFILINHSLDSLKRNIKTICDKPMYKRISEEQMKKFSDIDVICLENPNLDIEVITLEKLIKERNCE